MALYFSTILMFSDEMPIEQVVNQSMLRSLKRSCDDSCNNNFKSVFLVLHSNLETMNTENISQNVHCVLTNHVQDLETTKQMGLLVTERIWFSLCFLKPQD